MFKSVCKNSHIVTISLVLSFLLLTFSSDFAGATDPPTKDPAAETQTTETKADTNPEEKTDTEKTVDNKPDNSTDGVTYEKSEPDPASQDVSQADKKASDTENADIGETEPEKKLEVDVDKANVRSEASLKAKINTQLNKGEAVIVLQTKDDWYHVQLSNGETGWAHKDLFTEAKPSSDALKQGDKAKIKVSKGNIRKEPSTEAEILVQLKKGTEITIIEAQGDWYQVGLEDGQTGWAHKILFSKKKKGDHLLKGIRVEAGKNNEEKIFFIFQGFEPPKTFFTRTGSTRIVCDFPNTRLGKGIKQKNEVNGQLIQNIRTGLHNDNEDARIVFDLVPEQEYELEHIFVKGQVYMLIVKKV